MSNGDKQLYLGYKHKLESIVEELSGYADKGWVFRGMSDAGWGIMSSLERHGRRLRYNDLVDYEHRILTQFGRRARNYVNHIPEKEDMLAWMSLMQHHGGPTRLIDFTWSHIVALFFAVETADNDCAVWVMDYNLLQSLNSDKPNKNDEIAASIIKLNRNPPADVDAGIDCDEPFLMNGRLSNQQGTFVFQYNPNVSFEESLKNTQSRISGDNQLLKKIIIKKELLLEARLYLKKVNCDASLLFPGLDGYARSLQNFYL